MIKSKLNRIENLLSQTLVDMEKGQEKFIRILKKKDKYEKMTENLRQVNEKLEEKLKT